MTKIWISPAESPNHIGKYAVVARTHNNGTPHIWDFDRIDGSILRPSNEARQWLTDTGFKYSYTSDSPWFTVHFHEKEEAQLFAMAFGMQVELYNG